MNIIEKDAAPYRNKNGKKKRSQRVYMMKYNSLLAEADSLGIISIEFDENFSYARRIKILKEILRSKRVKS